MALSSYTDFYDKTQQAYIFPFTKNSVTTAAGTLRTAFTAAPFAGSAPGTTARTCTSATTGALLQQPQTPTRTTTLYAAELVITNPTAGNIVGGMLVDRLADVSGGTSQVTGTQGTGFAIAVGALPSRIGSNYSDIRAAAQVWTTTGAAPSTVVFSYTDEGGNASTAPAMNWPINSAINSIYPIPFEDGDRGVQAFVSANFSVVTGTAGNVGIVLYKPLQLFPPTNVNIPAVLGTANVSFNTVLDGVSITEIFDDACLDLWLYSTTTSTGIITGYLKLIEV